MDILANEPEVQVDEPQTYEKGIVRVDRAAWETEME